MRILHLFVMILFAMFAYWQMNDPDPIGWIILYLGVSFVALQEYTGKSILIIPLAGLVVCTFGMLLLIPDFINWISGGMPTITGSMKAESPHVELVREFLGFFLAWLAYLFYFILDLKRSRASES